MQNLMKRIFLKGWTNGDIVLNITLKYLVYHHSFIYGFYDETLCEESEIISYDLIFHDLPSNNRYPYRKVSNIPKLLLFSRSAFIFSTRYCLRYFYFFH